LVNWQGYSKETRYGLTSFYYQSLYQQNKLNKNLFEEKDFKTKIIIRESTFRLPKNPETPIVLMATGTGIAPYISFLQEMEYKKKQLNEITNKIILIFGSKNKKYDYIYEKDISKWKDECLIDTLYLAFSRDQEKKVYVQNIIQQNSESLKEIMRQGNIYVCGGVSMGFEVNLELEKIFTKEELKEKENENAYIKEFWGN